MNSVGKKLLFGIGLPAVAVAVGGVVFFSTETQRATSQAAREEAEAIAELVARTFAAATAREEGHDPVEAHSLVTQAVTTDLRVLRSIATLRVVDSQGVIRWSRQPEERGQTHSQAERLFQARNGVVSMEEGLPVQVLRPLQDDGCDRCHPVGDPRTPVGVLELSIHPTGIQKSLTSLFERVLVSVLIFALVLGTATALSLRWFLTRPLTRLAAVMRRAEQGDFLVRADVTRRDELGQLAQAFNRMLAAITSMKAEEIDTHRDLEEAQARLSLQQALERTNNKLQGRITELSTLYDVAKDLTSTLSLQELLDRIAHVVPERLTIPQFSIMLLNTQGDLEVRSAYPAEENPHPMTFQIGEGVCGLAAQTQRSWYVADAESDSSQYRVRAGASRSRGSLLSVPMIHGGTLLGVLNFERPEKAAFSAEDIDFLTAVADQAALAVKNAQLHEQTVELSLTDPLTSVANRRHLFSRLELEVARANRFGTQVSMLMVDIDHFKKLNDAAGHRAGDDVLRIVAELMRGMIRKVDTVARYGGEEFVIILPQVSKAEALEVAEKLRRSVMEAPIEHARDQPGGLITISVGVSNLPADATDQGRLVDCADSALYASKRAGRNRVTGYAAGMESHPGRERGPLATSKRKSKEVPAVPARPKNR